MIYVHLSFLIACKHEGLEPEGSNPIIEDIWYEDAEDNETTLEGDEDGDGYSTEDGDCNDQDSTIYPGAEEIPADGIDQDCDGEDGVAIWKAGTYPLNITTEGGNCDIPQAPSTVEIAQDGETSDLTIHWTDSMDFALIPSCAIDEYGFHGCALATAEVYSKQYQVKFWGTFLGTGWTEFELELYDMSGECYAKQYLNFGE